ncbi:UNVERIFIED_CONTAM: hypothetical protein PYX00_011045 [Menopon gallinae]|uniref:ribonuclease III n=1 Tax=Menopon gallinae TaxID=328185 RepID=A0AAW2H6S9_9NEOP
MSDKAYEARFRDGEEQEARLEEKVIKVISETLNPRAKKLPITSETKFKEDLKADSLEVYELDHLLASLEIPFSNYELLHLALVHKSYAQELGLSSENNERLEFLGDSVLGLVVTHKLYEKYPNYREGILARMKAFLVSESFLSEWALSYNLGAYVLFSRGEKATGGASKPAILADAFEALIGAFYLDQGLNTIKLFLEGYLDRAVSFDGFLEDIQDSKVLLQQWLQKHYGLFPQYELLEERGPDHQKRFLMSVQVSGHSLAKASGKSKKEAEKRAAKKAYEALCKRVISLNFKVK